MQEGTGHSDSDSHQTEMEISIFEVEPTTLQYMPTVDNYNPFHAAHTSQFTSIAKETINVCHGSSREEALG